LADGVEWLALVGRSFGGRVCTRLAAVEPPAALVVLGHPISPRGRPRPDDEAALAAVRCPTLIVQGEHDALGPLDVLQRIAAANPAIELYVLKGVGHQFGLRTAEGLEYAAAWLVKTLAVSV
jgi:predicted alpha/beta-hydrolase family hydrolase